MSDTPTTYTWELPRDATAPGAGRWYLREVAASDREAVDAELVVSELITNAWQHGYGNEPITLRVDIREDALHIEVCGHTTGIPVIQPATDRDAISGRGLLLIEELVQAWGYERSGEMLCVWADVPHLH